MFDDNVILQTKNGALDFQPSEPAQPLFGSMTRTPLMAELQITQEYLGHSTYLVYLLPMWREFLDFDTHCKGAGSTIAKILTGEVIPQSYRAIAGVANTGDSHNWTGHHFAQANWFAFGRLAWNPKLETHKITSEWIKSTWNCDKQTLKVVEQMMMPTWKSFVCSHAPYSIGFTVQVKGHYLAGFEIRANKEWKIDNESIGNDRTITGSDYVSQYFEPNRSLFNDINQCPELYLLCFHRTPWNHKMKSGLTLREELIANLKQGIEQVDRNIELWKSLRGKIDERRFGEVMESLATEKKDTQAFYDSAIHFFNLYK